MLVVTGSGEGELLNVASRRNAPNGVPACFGKPEIAIGAAGNSIREAATGTGGRKGELLNAASSRNPSDVVPLIFGKPEIAIRAAGDPVGIAGPGNTATGGGEGEL